MMDVLTDVFFCDTIVNNDKKNYYEKPNKLQTSFMCVVIFII